LVRPVPRAHKASKDLSVPRGPSASAGRLALPDQRDQSDRRVRRGRLVARAQSAPLANAERPDRKVPLVRPARRDRRARRVTPARLRQFAWSPVAIAFAAEMTKSWLVLFARAVRPTERSARCPARQQPVCVYVGDCPEPLARRCVCQSGAARLQCFWDGVSYR
jgi:hypothetical protein